MNAKEFNFDGLVGLTHTYAGLSYGNIASMSHRSMVSNPKEAALQGLTKAKALADLGMGQGILPPQQRPDLVALRAVGFTGKDAEVLKQAHKIAPELLAACSSASSMWTANAATVSPSADSADRRVHFTAANLTEKFHRAIEHQTTTRILKAIFRDEKHFAHHSALPSSATFGDEGAANHTRFCDEYGKPGLQFFVYGRAALGGGSTNSGKGVTSDFNAAQNLPREFPARQTMEASHAISRLHQLDDERIYFARQNPQSIDAGAFHNDVISVGNKNLLFCHEFAFAEQARVLDELSAKYSKICADSLQIIQVPNNEVTLADAVKSYLFNSQLVSVGKKMILIAPEECRNNESVRTYLDRLLTSARSPIAEVKYFDLRQSMRNGGGPACLRLRVVLTEKEQHELNPSAILTDELFEKLNAWIHKHYRDRMVADDLQDPQLIAEGLTALDELTKIMNLGSIYPFQLGSA